MRFSRQDDGIFITELSVMHEPCKIVKLKFDLLKKQNYGIFIVTVNVYIRLQMMKFDLLKKQNYGIFIVAMNVYIKLQMIICVISL